MSEKLKELPGAQKKAVVALACMLEAQSKNGHFSTIDPEVDTIARACFPANWVGNWDSDYRHTYFASAVSLDKDDCVRMVSELDDVTKFAFKNLLLDLAQDNAIRLIVAASMLQGIGLEPHVNPQSKRGESNEDSQEDDGTYVVENPFYARICDASAVRGENDEVFTLKKNVTDVGERIGANYEQWLKQGVCPTNGLVGHSVKSVDTPEGKLQFLYCSLGNEQCMVIPVLEAGLEVIDKWAEEDKKVNNRILAYDRSGERCKALRAELKDVRITDGPVAGDNPGTDSKDETVIHFIATHLERIEEGNHQGPNIQYRRIDLTYTNRGRDVKIEVLQVMKPRYARIEYDDGTTLTYRDVNYPPFYYEVETSPVDGSVVRLSMFQLNERGEYKEYRYTV